ncbi:MAG: hypothetical protein H0U81_11480 [Pyrinomonadaceae bacterium]|nr:hypothetical protein [Pyrinomonadaceae bacterium]
MSPAELLAADDHLAVCEACRLKTRMKTIDTMRAEAMLTSLRTELYAASRAETGHLAYEQIEALVDNQLNRAARETIEEHIRFCASCAAEMRDLSAFKSTLATTAADQPPRAASPTTAERLRAFWHWPSQWAWPQFATATVVLFIATAAALLFVWKPTDLTQTELAQRSPDAPIAQPSSLPTMSESTQPSVDTAPDSTAPARRNDVPLSPPSAVASPAEIVIAVNDGGGRVTLDRRGNVTGLDGLSPTSQQAIRTALTTGAVKTPRDLAELSRSAGTLMGEAGDGVAFPLVNPVGVVVRGDRPTLRWQPLSGATSYTVTLLDSDSGATMTSPPLNATEWAVPRRLMRGGTYTWQVTAMKDGRDIISPAAPAPEARFKVLGQSKVAELERMERAKVNSHLTRGVLYAEAGLLSDAEREFASLVKANPRSPIARKLLRSVEALRLAKQQ